MMYTNDVWCAPLQPTCMTYMCFIRHGQLRFAHAIMKIGLAWRAVKNVTHVVQYIRSIVVMVPAWLPVHHE